MQNGITTTDIVDVIDEYFGPRGRTGFKTEPWGIPLLTSLTVEKQIFTHDALTTIM
jgi:hypothetical protein